MHLIISAHPLGEALMQAYSNSIVNICYYNSSHTLDHVSNFGNRTQEFINNKRLN